MAMSRTSVIGQHCLRHCEAVSSFCGIALQAEPVISEVQLCYVSGERLPDFVVFWCTAGEGGDAAVEPPRHILVHGQRWHLRRR